MNNQLDKLRALIKKLRSKEGCPWDKKQTSKSNPPPASFNEFSQSDNVPSSPASFTSPNITVDAPQITIDVPTVNCPISPGNTPIIEGEFWLYFVNAAGFETGSDGNRIRTPIIKYQPVGNGVICWNAEGVTQYISSTWGVYIRDRKTDPYKPKE